MSSRTMSTGAYYSHSALPRWRYLQRVEYGTFGQMGSYIFLGSYQPRFVSVPKGPVQRGLEMCGH